MTSYLFFVIITIRIEIIVVGGVLMEQKMIHKTSKQCVFFIKDNNLDFYLIIPNSRQVNIVLGLFSDVNDDMIKSLSDENDKALVVPVISNQILTSANHLDTTSFKYLDGIFSYLINISYKILTGNKIGVDKKILINNNPLYENFNNKYLEKYQGRVELYNLVKKVDTTQSIFTTVEEKKEATFKPVEPLFQNQVTNDVRDAIEESIEPILYDEPVITSSDKIGDTREPGFVSYVLLGVLIAVISLVFLYMIL